MKILFVALLLFSTLKLTAAIEIPKCKHSAMQAQTDIKNKKVYVMLQGGIAPIHVIGQEVFERKYNVSYFDLGCVVPANLCIEHYNAEVGKYLDKIYGKKWRKEVRVDVKGLGV